MNNLPPDIMKHIALLISCEHAVNTVPYDYQTLFERHKELLESHRGIDFGALEIAQSIHKKTIAVCFRLPVQGSWLIATGVLIIPIAFQRLQTIYPQMKRKKYWINSIFHFAIKS